MLAVLCDVLEDKGFQIPSSNAAKARQDAVLMYEWASKDENRQSLQSFSTTIVGMLETALPITHSITAEKLWSKYHSHRVSTPFKTQWHLFAVSVLGESTMPILSQHLTDLLMDQIRFPIILPKPQHQNITLTIRENQALRYSAGYVCKHVLKKLEKSSHPHKDELIDSIADLYRTSPDDSGDSSDEDRSTVWLKAIDRGGLCHVTDATFLVFQAMEMVVRNHLNKTHVSARKDTIINVMDITSDEDVLFYWCMASTTSTEAVDDKCLLKMIAELWITVRGFSFVSGWMEEYKQATKRSLQKAKGLRSGLCQSK